MKTCLICGKEVTIKRGRWLCSPECKKIRKNQIDNAWSKRNYLPKKKGYNQMWKEKHKEQYQATAKKYRQTHKDYLSEYNKKYRAKNKIELREKNRLQLRVWRVKNREKIRAYYRTKEGRAKGLKYATTFNRKYPTKKAAYDRVKYGSAKTPKKDFCEWCGNTKELMFHHTNYEKDEGLTLCRFCHHRIHFPNCLPLKESQ